MLDLPPLDSVRGGAGYDFWSGHLDWLNPAPAELDVKIDVLCRRLLDAMPARAEH